MRKIVLLLLAICLIPAFAFANGQQEGEKSAKGMQLKDGIYFAADQKFDEKTGWKECVTLEVKDGKIVSAEWNGANVDGGTDKITRSKSGQYGMVKFGKAQAEWDVQAKKAEEYLVKSQDPTAIKYSDAEGHTDAISGVSIHVKGFFTLAQEALEKGPVGYGMWKDGHFHSEAASFDEKTGWKSTFDATVISGYILAANWNAVNKAGGDDKKTQSKDGRYGMMANGGAQAEWHDQAAKVEAYLVKTQDPTDIKYSDQQGHTDAISGVSIHVSEFFTLAQKALQKR